jgi:hypothetical protein
MKWLTLIALVLASAPALAEKKKLDYHGRDAHGAAVIDHGEGKRAAKVGDDVPGWGKVKSIDEEQIVLQRLLGDEERAALLKKGLIPFAAKETIVPRFDKRVILRSPQD